jgi:hypothetical protein
MIVNHRLRNCFFFILVAGLAWTSFACRKATRSQAEETALDQQSGQQSVQQSVQQSAQNFIAQADNQYAQREDLARVRQAIIFLRQARTADFGNYEARWKLAEFNYFLGENTTDKTERETAFRDGIEAGKEAVKLQPEKAEGHFWLGANYGGSAQTSTLAGLSSVNDIRTEMETVLRLDESYEDGSAYMVLGQLYLEAPKMLGGDTLKAIQILEKGRRYAETNSAYRLELAKAYLAVERKADARKELNAIINMKPDPSYMPEHKRSLEEAHKLLDNGS